ncbi:MAG: hypothetical protein WC992_08935, partial [Acholeplasmataceae bacterium]
MTKMQRFTLPGNPLDNIAELEARVRFLEEFVALSQVDFDGGSEVVIQVPEGKNVKLDGSNQDQWIPNPVTDRTQDIGGSFNLAGPDYTYKINDVSVLRIGGSDYTSVLVGPGAADCVARRNVIVGADSGANLLSYSDWNVILGYYSATAVEEIESCIVIGATTLNMAAGAGWAYSKSVIIGSDIYAQGYLDSSIVIGQFALANLAGVCYSSYDIFIGASAGRFLTDYSGHSNVCVGPNVAVGLTTGYENVLLGSMAGYSLSSGKLNVFIGNQAGYSETGNSNRLYIENSNSATPLIGGNFATNQVGINRAISDLTHTFEVGGSGAYFGNLDLAGNLNFDTTRNITTTAGNLNLIPGNHLVLDPAGGSIFLQPGIRLVSSGYTSQTAGMQLTAGGAADLRYLFADEMHVKSFIADLEQALAGGQIISKKVAILSRDFILPSGILTGELYVEDLPGATGVPVFEDGDWVALRKYSLSAGELNVGWCWGTVSGYVSLPLKEQKWIFLRDSTTPGTATGTVEKGSLALDFGVSGNGFYEVNSADGLWAENSPYAQIVTWDSHPANQTVQTRFGNLKGITGILEYGMLAGSGVANSDQYFRFSDQAVEIHNIPLTIHDSTNTVIKIEPNVPYISVGTSAPTSYLGGDGFWVGYDVGVYKFHLGDVDGELFTWNGTTLYLGKLAGEHIRSAGGALSFYYDNSKMGELNSTTWTLGNVDGGHVEITPTAVQIKRSTHVLSEFSNTVKMWDDGGTQRVQLNSDGSGWFVSPTKLSWDTGGNISMTGSITLTNTISSASISDVEPFDGTTSSLSDAGALATADNLDDVGDGSTYGRIAKTIIAGG